MFFGQVLVNPDGKTVFSGAKIIFK